MSTTTRYVNTRPEVAAEEAMTLPARYYTDPELFHRELRAVHHDMWLSAGRTEQLPEPGSYFLVRFAGVNVIVDIHASEADAHPGKWIDADVPEADASDDWVI